MFFDPDNKRSIAFEFKPPTETKRGILTGVGQSIAYLSEASVSFLIAPSHVEGYNIAVDLEKLYKSKIYDKLPTGLIVYDDDYAKSLTLAVDIGERAIISESKIRGIANRYWAKHQDLPLHLIWLILDEAYNLPDIPNRRATIWKNCWNKYLYPTEHRNTLTVYPTIILKHDGNPLYVFDRIKTALKEKIDDRKITMEEALEVLKKESDTEYVGDNLFNAYGKNYITFIKHLQLWDDNGNLTEDGLHLHRIGKLHKPQSLTFRDHFAKILLFNGKHLDLILDVENKTRNKIFNNVNEVTSYIRDDFIENGYYKRNPGRGTGETQQFLKYERIIWGHIGILTKINNKQYMPGKGFNFDWKQITRLCSL